MKAPPPAELPMLMRTKLNSLSKEQGAKFVEHRSKAFCKCVEVLPTLAGGLNDRGGAVLRYGWRPH